MKAFYLISLIIFGGYVNAQVQAINLLDTNVLFCGQERNGNGVLSFSSKEQVFYDHLGNDTMIVRFNYLDDPVLREDRLFNLSGDIVQQEFYEMDTLAQAWYAYPFKVVTSSYNTFGDIDSIITYERVNGTMEEIGREEHYYDGSQHEIKFITMTSSVSSSDYNYQILTSSYDVNNLLAYQIDSVYDYFLGAWELNKYVLSYDTQGNLLARTTYDWDGVQSLWYQADNSRVIEYAYDQNNRLIEEVEYAYHANGNTLVTQENYYYNTVTGVVDSTTFLQGTEIYKYENSYNAQGYLSEVAVYLKYTTTSTWDFLNLMHYEYASNGEQIYWDKLYLDGNGDWELCCSYGICNMESLGETTVQRAEQLSLYPNPTAGRIKIASPINGGRLMLINLTGQVVYSALVNEGLIEIDLERLGLVQGVYVVRITDTDHQLQYMSKLMYQSY
ncbi:T9SS type A sorting domain-containing protein [Parvicella tangerina]|uniref:Secretion system C-terminal sorting domain-containing protein n=1 Tax=Parvicella tangerina TaxID=2829795 RepID=A0A916JPA1_9FLAO|nr:T9SS type A sorting domain-containing protein [Parvicella tangerina]CAG5083831.1 hypothetical protein CRYO30217_02304 [Parvicella tangerina]